VVVQSSSKQRLKEEQEDQVREHWNYIAICIADAPVPLNFTPFRGVGRKGEIVALVSDPENHPEKYPAGDYFSHSYELYKNPEDGQSHELVRIIPTPRR
jgi:hypothetical protein